jgi:hypothetical protein
MNNTTDIIDEIERHLSKYRLADPECSLKLKLKYLDEPAYEGSTASGTASASNAFNKTWCKLGLPEKLNRLMRYLTKVQAKLNLNAVQTESLRKFFYENVNTSLSSDTCVSYDPVDAEIITIMGLKCEGNNFYIHTAESQPKPEGIRVKQRVFANIGQLLSSEQKTSEAPPVQDKAMVHVQYKEVPVQDKPATDNAMVPPPPDQKAPIKKPVIIKKKLNAPSQ